MRFWVVLVACLLVAALLGVVPGRGAAAEVESEILGTVDDDWVTVSMVDGDVVAEWGGESLVLPAQDANIVVKLRNGDDRFVIDQDVEYASLTVEGQLGDDSIVGGAGDDVLDGGVGDDIVIGGGGDDQISGSTQDEISGHTDDDILIGGFGKNTIDGGTGNDYALVQTTSDGSPVDTVSAAAVIYDEADLPEPARDLYHLMIEQYVMLHVGPDETAAVDSSAVPAEVVITDNAGIYQTDDWSNTVSVPIDSLFEIDAVVSAYQADPSPATLGEINKIFQSKPDYVRFLVWWLDEDDTEDSRVTDLNYVFDETIEPYIAQNAAASFIQYYGEGIFGYNNGAMFIPTIGALDWHGTDSDTVDTFVEYEKLQNLVDAGSHEAITSFSINPDTNTIEVAVYDDPDNPVDLPAMQADLAHLETAEFYLTDVPHQTDEDLIGEVEEEVEISQDRGLQEEVVKPILGERISSLNPTGSLYSCSLGGHWQLGESDNPTIYGGLTAGHCTPNLTRDKIWGHKMIYKRESYIGDSFHNFDAHAFLPGPIGVIGIDAMLVKYHTETEGFKQKAETSARVYDNDRLKTIKDYNTYPFHYGYLHLTQADVCVSGVRIGQAEVQTACSKIFRSHHTTVRNKGTEQVPRNVSYETVMLADDITEEGMSGGPAFTRNVDGTANNIGIIWGANRCPCDSKYRTVFTKMSTISHKIHQLYGAFRWIVE